MSATDKRKRAIAMRDSNPALALCAANTSKPWARRWLREKGRFDLLAKDKTAETKK